MLLIELDLNSKEKKKCTMIIKEAIIFQFNHSHTQILLLIRSINHLWMLETPLKRSFYSSNNWTINSRLNHLEQLSRMLEINHSKILMKASTDHLLVIVIRSNLTIIPNMMKIYLMMLRSWEIVLMLDLRV